MTRNSQKQLVPKDGQTLQVCVVSRISGCQNQKEASLEDQQDNAKDEVCELYDGPTPFHIIATKGKGERLDRPELLEIEDALRSGRFDLFVFDDLSRLIRGGEAARLLGIGVDNGTRTICINDGIDSRASHVVSVTSGKQLYRQPSFLVRGNSSHSLSPKERTMERDKN